MLGIWHAIHQWSDKETKFIFSIIEDEGYKLVLSTEPTPAFLPPMSAAVAGNTLRAEGVSYFVPGKVEIVLEFAGDAVDALVKLPGRQPLQLKGARGRGKALAERLIPLVAPYRKEAVAPRSDEDIRIAVEALLGSMSLQDKLGQMSQCGASDFSFGGEVSSEPPEKLVADGKVGSILGAFDSGRVFELQQIAVTQSPHGIPLLFNADVIHGFQTIFPVPLAWSCSWDTEAVKLVCAIAAKEAAASGISYNHGPMVDITRDPRWGRVMEGAGEDPYLGALMAKAQVEGYQGASLHDADTIIACLKHFIAYGAAEGGRDYNTVDISEGTLRNVYLPPFIAGIEAGAGSVMNAFNIYDGVPVIANDKLLKDMLRDELGFDGIVISDYGSIDEIHIHGAARDAAESAKLALNASLDLEMVTRHYYDHLPELVRQGAVSEEQINAAVRRILTYKYKIGIMDDPFRYVQPEQERDWHFHPDHLAASLELARKSIVLLKNDGVLPLRQEGETLALIGPFASSKDLLGAWQFSRYESETVTLKGMTAKGYVPPRLLTAAGCAVHEEIEGGFAKAIAAAKQADVVVLALGESSAMSGEAASRTELSLPAVQLRLAEEIVKLGKPVVLVLTNGRPLVLDWFEQHASAIVETWFLGSQAGHAIADVLTGDYNPSGRLTMSFPYHAGQVPVYYNHYNTGRPVTPDNKDAKFISKYLDAPNEPLYPFGFGLSYTDFAYANLKLDQSVIRPEEQLTASVEVANVGQRAGEETVQLYIRDLYGSVVRPVKELKGFRKIYLQPGEQQTVSFSVTAEDLKFYTRDGSFQAEYGEFKLFVGPNSRELLAADFELKCNE
jgi:beta-glucosidase